MQSHLNRSVHLHVLASTHAQVLLYWGATDDKILKISARFPSVRYFSYQSYDLLSGRPISSLIDYQVKAATGINPFREPPMADTTTTASGTYEIYVTPRGDQGYGNELPILPPAPSGETYTCKGQGCLALVLFRLYTAEPERDASYGHDASRVWGYVPTPQVALRYFRSSYGSLRWRKEEDRYRQLPACKPSSNTLGQIYLNKKLKNKQVDFPKTRTDTMDDNFMPLIPTTSKRPLFPNTDATYLFATASNDFVEQGKMQLVARITIKLPVTANSIFHEPMVGKPSTYDVRYASVSTIWLKGVGPTMDTVMDTTILSKYRHIPNWNRHFTVVTAPSEDFLLHCPMVYNETTDLFLSTMLDGDVASSQGFLYRQILSRWQVTGQQGDKSNAWAKYRCLQQGGSQACSDPGYIQSLMEDMYPRISYYFCGLDNDGHCLCHDSGGFPVSKPLQGPIQEIRATSSMREEASFISLEAPVISATEQSKSPSSHHDTATASSTPPPSSAALPASPPPKALPAKEEQPIDPPHISSPSTSCNGNMTTDTHVC